MAKDSGERNDVPWYRNPSVIGGLVALAAGGGAYAFARRPTFASSNPMLADIQRRGASKGFHRIIDVTPRRLKGGAGILERLQHWLRPASDKKGRLDAVNRALLWLQEGGEAIPVMARKGKIFRATADGRTRDPLRVKGVVFDRIANIGNVQGLGGTARSLVRGGIDAEGPSSVLQKMTQIGRSKSHEAKLFQRYAPKAIPDTMSDLPTLTGATREEQLRNLHDAIAARFGKKDFFLKQDNGLASSGHFPRRNSNWVKQHDKFLRMTSDPAKSRKLQHLLANNETEAAYLLRKHKAYEGYVLDQILKNPKGGLAQSLIKNPVDEWRVHVMSGAAPADMITSRFGAKPELLRDPFGVKKQELQAFAEKTVAKLPKSYRRGTYGFDIMEYTKKNGKRGYKILETNSTEPATAITQSGRSDFLSHDYFPYIGHRHYKTMTGRETVPMALRNAGAAGLLAGGAAYGGSRLLSGSDREDA